MTKCPKHTDITIIQGDFLYLIFKYTQISVIYNRPRLQGINILYFKNVIFYAKIFWCRRIFVFQKLNSLPSSGKLILFFLLLSFSRIKARFDHSNDIDCCFVGLMKSTDECVERFDVCLFEYFLQIFKLSQASEALRGHLSSHLQMLLKLIRMLWPRLNLLHAFILQQQTCELLESIYEKG